MTPIKSISYDTDFYWRGNRYTQVIRPKKPNNKFSILCRLFADPCGEYIDMPAGRKVKPVVKLNTEAL